MGEARDDGEWRGLMKGETTGDRVMARVHGGEEKVDKVRDDG